MNGDDHMGARGVLVVVGFGYFPVPGNGLKNFSRLLWVLNFHPIEEFVFRFRSEVWQQSFNIVKVYFFNVKTNFMLIGKALRFLDLFKD